MPGTQSVGSITMLLVALLIACPVPASAGETAAVVAQDQTVSMVVRFGDRREQMTLADLPWRENMTVEAVMKLAKESNEEFTYRFSGSGETFFVKEIAGFANEGRSGDNWIFRVNDKLGDRSAGVFPVKAGDRIEWRLGKYRVDDTRRFPVVDRSVK